MKGLTFPATFTAAMLVQAWWLGGSAAVLAVLAVLACLIAGTALAIHRVSTRQARHARHASRAAATVRAEIDADLETLAEIEDDGATPEEILAHWPDAYRPRD